VSEILIDSDLAMKLLQGLNDLAAGNVAWLDIRDELRASLSPAVEAIPANSPNVLSEEEARLLDRANHEPEPSSPEELQAFTALLDRLTNWAEGSTNA
jgi:hypothetical protein